METERTEEAWFTTAPRGRDHARHCRRFAILLALCALALIAPVYAQTVHVDITPGHSTNSFVPRESLGAGIDRIPVAAIDHDLTPGVLKQVFAAGWQPVSYRQNTDLAIEAWHWNPEGSWSEPGEKGYFVGSTKSTTPIRYSFGYALPHRGVTRNDGTGAVGYSRLSDGDESTYWKSNPYLSSRFTHESDALHPQWVIVDLADIEAVDTLRIAWAAPYATQFVVQYWTGLDPMQHPTAGAWSSFPKGEVEQGSGGVETVRLSELPVQVRFVRIWMTKSSDTCDTPDAQDPRHCVGYAIRELYLGTTTADGVFHDLMRHTADQEQTATYASSVDPWHDATSEVNDKEAQVGFDLFFKSGVTQNLPALIPIAMLYDTPDNAVAEIRYLEEHHYPIAGIEMGEEADGQFMQPEDYGALYLQYADALRRLDPNLKLGGPSFQGVNQDIEAWPDSQGRSSWLERFLVYLKSHGRMKDLQFFSFEHYPLEPCRINWASLYQEPALISHIMDVWHNDGVPRDLPMYITETNLSSSISETYVDNFSGLWLADFVGSFLNSGGNAVYYFHYLPLKMERGCNDSIGTFGMFSVGPDYQIEQPMPQFFASQMLNHDWLGDRSDGMHHIYPAESDVQDGAGHSLVTAYAAALPDGDDSILLVNKDQNNHHPVQLIFDDRQSHSSGFLTGEVRESVFGREQYRWHSSHREFNAHLPQADDNPPGLYTHGRADPDGPISRSSVRGEQGTKYDLPPASIIVLRGKLAPSGSMAEPSQARPR